MSNVNPSTPAPTDEAGIERVVREILFPLDQRLEVSTNWGCSIFALVIAPAVFCLLWLWLRIDAWGAVGVALIGSFLVWIFVSNWLDEFAAKRAVRIFNARFPEDHPARPIAIQMLSEMECPNKAQEKLRDAIQRSSPRDRIVRHRREDPEQALQNPATPTPPVIQPPTQPTPTPTPTQPTTRPGFGAFENIPLDINPGDDPNKDKK